MALRLVGVTAYTPLERIADALLVIEEGVFSYVGPRGACPSAPADEVLDLGAALACPGFVDLQVNGLGAECAARGGRRRRAAYRPGSWRGAERPLFCPHSPRLPGTS